jgi:hypothetical protein
MSRPKLGDILIEEGMIDEMQLKSALSHQRQWGGFVGQILIDQGFVNEIGMYDTLARKFGQRRVDLGNRKISPDVVKTLSPNICIEKNIFPIEYQDRILLVATSLPQDVETTDQIAFQLGIRVESVLATPREIDWAIRFYIHGDPSPCPPAKEAVTKQAHQIEPTAAAGLAGQRAAPGASMLGQIEQDILDPFSGDLSGEYKNIGIRAQPDPVTSSLGAPAAGAGPAGARRTMVQGTLRTADLSQAVADAKQAPKDDSRQKRILQSLVELCIEKGIFSAQEFRAKLAEKEKK